jgi:hypothetical protein
MRKIRLAVLLLLLIVVVIAAAAYGLGIIGDSSGGDSEPQGTPAPTPIPIIGQSGESVGMTVESSLLLWVADGLSPAQLTPANPGKIVALYGDGTVTELLNLPAGITRLNACGERATSPDGRFFAFYAGGDTGSLYFVDGVNAPSSLAEVNALTCLGMGTFLYSPDSQRLGYINYAADASSSEFPVGALVVADTVNPANQTTFENVTAFDLATGLVSFVSGFADSQGDVTEAGIFVWAGDGNPSEISTLFADNGCEFRSASLAFVTTEQLIVNLGQRCNGSRTTWALYSVDIDGRAAGLELSGNAVGSYFAASRPNTVIVAPDGETAYFTYPDGLAQNTVTLRAISLTDMEASDTLAANAIMPRFVAGRPFDVTANARPVISPDERWFAIVTNNGNNEAAINILDLNMPELPPLTISAGNRGDTISSMAFTADSAQLLFVSGGNDGGNNSLFTVNLATSIDSRVVRGRFDMPLVVASDNAVAAIPNWQSEPENRLTLVGVNLLGNDSTILYDGATFDGDALINRRFVYPLSWRQ